MKTKLFLLAALVLVLKTPIHAADDHGKDGNVSTQSTNNMNIAMPYPTQALQNGIEGFVLVEMSRNTAGNMVVTQANGSDPKLISAVINYLNQQDLRSRNEETILLRFDFNIL